MSDGCGLMGCHPKWFQRFANTRWFMIVYGLLGTIQATSFLYFVVTLSTIEKRFKVPSQTTGIIISGNEISEILLSLVLSYAGGQRNRPQWIAWGVACSALSCFILASPHFIYGGGEDAFHYTQEYLDLNANVSTELIKGAATSKTNTKICQNSTSQPNESDEVFSYLPLILIFLSQFVLGIGTTLYYTLGQTYLDDNTKQRNTPLMLAYAFSMRLFGPVLSFPLAYGTLNMYIDPTLKPVIAKDDLRWMGAWWSGWLILGVLMFLFAGLIGMFPKHLARKSKTQTDQEKCNRVFEVTGETESNKDADIRNFPKALMRLFRNKLIMFNSIATIFYVIGGSSFITFMSRMMEVQFNRSSANGSIFTGPVTITGMIFGFLSSGYVITKFKPRPRYLFFWSVIVGLCSMSAHISYSTLGCEGGNTLMLNGTLRSCNSNCACDGISYTPVCDMMTKETFFSPCHAGCRDFDEKENVYKNCVCDELSRTDVLLSTAERVITSGSCFDDCTVDYYTFSLISLCASLLGTTARIGNILLSFRAVEPRDKSIAQGFSVFVVSLFAFIPGPIIFGRVIDSTCLVWNYDQGGERGNCQLYDPLMFRYLLHITAAGFILVGVCFDVLVWYFAQNLELYGEDENDEKNKVAENSAEQEPLNKN